MKPRSSISARVVVVAAVALLALAGVRGEAAATNKITVSPALAEAVENGEAELPAITASPVKSQWVEDASSNAGRGSSSPVSSLTPSTITPVITDPAAPKPNANGEIAVDTFKSKESLSGSTSGGSNGILIAVAVVGCVGAAAMAIVYKRRAVRHNDDDDDDDADVRSRQQPQPSQSRATFESANFTPGRPSVDGMLQDDRMSTGSSMMMSAVRFSAADPMVMNGGGVVRLSSPFGANGARISSPAGRAIPASDSIEFSTAPPRGHTAVSYNDARSTAVSSTHSGSTAIRIDSEVSL
ncbi:hypothetical protein PybrP1_010529 [[Pythium] brassicae (nom. inval.)]|nr:hypothetical protein PybrP1_010529 [[Pythium] brassicae (nom. inval.)]